MILHRVKKIGLYIISFISFSAGFVVMTSEKDLSLLCRKSCAFNSLLGLIFGDEFGKTVYGLIWLFIGIFVLVYALRTRGK